MQLVFVRNKEYNFVWESNCWLTANLVPTQSVSAPGEFSFSSDLLAPHFISIYLQAAHQLARRQANVIERRINRLRTKIKIPFVDDHIANVAILSQIVDAKTHFGSPKTDNNVCQRQDPL